jgi:chromosome segregation and condensation protein ScpB
MSPETDSPATAQQLGESYATLVGAKDWHVDEVPGPVTESRTPDTTPPPHPSATSKPPLAEAVNEPTVPPTPVQIIEALLFVGGLPLTAEHAAEAIRGLSPDQFRDCIDILNRVYRAQNRPYAVEHGATGYVLRVGPRYSGVREKLFGGPREARLTQQALDVLSLVAYRQPIGKAEVDAARGLDSVTILRQLLRLGLIATESGSDSGETLYGTTTRFLEVFRLRDLADLPELGEPKRVG